MPKYKCDICEKFIEEPMGPEGVLLRRVGEDEYIRTNFLELFGKKVCWKCFYELCDEVEEEDDPDWDDAWDLQDRWEEAFDPGDFYYEEDDDD